jgi:hypothetical protein
MMAAGRAAAPALKNGVHPVIACTIRVGSCYDGSELVFHVPEAAGDLTYALLR